MKLLGPKICAFLILIDTNIETSPILISYKIGNIHLHNLNYNLYGNGSQICIHSLTHIYSLWYFCGILCGISVIYTYFLEP